MEPTTTLPPKAEKSGDGMWATVFGPEGEILQVWARVGL
jgi:hypothetical protein